MRLLWLISATERRTRAAHDPIAEARAGVLLDFVRDLAARLPIAIIFAMMDVPESDWPTLFRYANMHTAPEDPEYSIGTVMETREHAVRGMLDYCRELALKRRGGSGVDLLSMLAHIEVDGQGLTDDELGANGLMFVIAGQETTRNSLSAGMRELIGQPSDLERLRGNPKLLRTAPDEFVRWGSPVAHLLRTATADLEIADKRIKAEDWVVCWMASANRDESVFDQPFLFDVGRSPNPHVSFGYGPHFCLGAFLARLEIRVFMELLLERVARVELNGDPQPVSAIQFCGLKSLPIRVVPRSGV